MFEKFFGNNPDKNPQNKDNSSQNKENKAINEEINKIGYEIKRNNDNNLEKISGEWSAEFQRIKDEVEIAENILTKIIEYYKSHYPNVEMGAPLEDLLEDIKEEGSNFDEKTANQINAWIEKYKYEINKMGSLSNFIRVVSRRRDEDIMLINPGPENK